MRGASKKREEALPETNLVVVGVLLLLVTPTDCNQVLLLLLREILPYCLRQLGDEMVNLRLELVVCHLESTFQEFVLVIRLFVRLGNANIILPKVGLQVGRSSLHETTELVCELGWRIG